MREQFGFRDVATSGFETKSTWPITDQLGLLARLLAPALGDRRARQLSGQLLSRFGSLPNVLAATPARLTEVAGVDSATIRLLATTMEAAQKLARLRIEDERPLLTSSSHLRDYLHVKMAYLAVEQFRILFLDKKNRLIIDEVQQTGTIDHAPVYPREVVRRALELSASAVVLVHNHPSGDPTPSAADIRMTTQVIDAARPLDLIVHDHVIVGRSGVLSLRSLGLLGG